ncbi:MAG: M60 family metallopeptidase [Bacteroidaceae bacterium]|nr:M60 family metallopeptidase [Bacteroidaceae bacterium]
MHCDNSNVVVGYYVSDNKSKWTLEDATVDPTDLLNQQLAFQEATATQLTQFFTTTACTTLKGNYASMNDAGLRSAMSSLPSTVQDMAIKVKNNSWTTYSGWDKTERTFRVADYKAYSSYSRWTGILGLRYNLARTENPTGIYVEAGDYLQVYVGNIPSGQSVQLAVAGYGAGGSGGSGIVTYSLHSGMNALQMTSEGNCFVIYQVDNTTNGAAPYTALSNYADVTVHIEGGTVQGYFDLTKGDDNDDWTQLKTHLMTKDMFCMKTKTLVFNLQTDLVKTAVNGAGGSGSTGELVEMLEYWQGVQDMEDDLFNRASLGGANYEYCNNVHSVTTIGNSGDGLLYAYTNGIYFSPEQHNRLFNNKLIREGSDNLWASAHELGHHRQGQINMVGNTEISNNIYSNVAVYQQGRYTSRTASLQTVFSDYQNGISWPERVRLANSSGTSGAYNQQLLHLNWSLYIFFHINGNKPTFFQDLYTAFRDDPMTNVKGEGTLTPASADYLKYYVKCCEVSGYDLTDFFAAYGFFMLPPEQTTEITYNGVKTNRYQTIGDYGTYNLYVTQEMIDEAKTQVKAMSGLKQCNIVFIEDRVSAPLATYDGHAEGELKQPNDASSVTFGSVGETGQYTDFDAECSAYSYNVSERGNVTMQGSGAVGFIVYDGNGNIIGYYNTNSFSLPEGVTGYTIKAAAGNGTTVASTLDASIEVQEFPKTGVWYTLSTPLRGSRYTTSNGAGEGVVGAATSTSEPTNAMQWQFVLREGEYETFDIVNRNDGSYLDPSATYNTQIVTSKDKPAAGWKLQPAATAGLYIIVSGSAQLNQTNNGGTNGNMLYNWGGGSNTGDAGCQFAINEVELVQSFPETGVWYTLSTPKRESLYVMSNGTGQGLKGSQASEMAAAMQWQFVPRAGENDSYDIVNRSDGSYINPSSAANNSQMYTSGEQPSAGWQVEEVSDGLYIIFSGTSQLHQSNSSREYVIINYGSGTNTTDDGCLYAIEEASPDYLSGKEIKIVYGLNSEGTYGYWNNLTWTSNAYSGQAGLTMTLSNGTHDKFSSLNRRYNLAYHPAAANTEATITITAPEGSVITGYSLETGVYNGTTYSLTTEGGTNILPADINGSSNYTPLTVSGFNTKSTTITVTTTDASKWLAIANFTVTLAKTVTLNVVGDKSYATFYYDTDVQTDGTTKAYYIESATSTSATLTETANDGRDIPAHTAVVLINEEQATSTVLTLASGLTQEISETDNLLKGTLVAKTLDLSSSSPYYSMGRLNGQIGFYKFNSNGTTSITLGAHKAFLEVPGASNSNGFILTLDDVTGINEIGVVNGQSSMVNGQSAYNLWGRKVAAPQKGEIYIVNGKKVIMK